MYLEINKSPKSWKRANVIKDKQFSLVMANRYNTVVPTLNWNRPGRLWLSGTARNGSKSKSWRNEPVSVQNFWTIESILKPSVPNCALLLLFLNNSKNIASSMVWNLNWQFLTMTKLLVQQLRIETNGLSGNSKFKNIEYLK